MTFELNTQHLIDWFPVADIKDLTDRTILHSQLNNLELAVWASDDGEINVWENRCVHRGVRLTIGSHLGNRIKCRYHGWEYSKNTGSCEFLPANRALNGHPTAKIKQYPYFTLAGKIWINIKEESRVPDIEFLQEIDFENKPLFRKQVFHYNLDQTVELLLNTFNGLNNSWKIKSLDANRKILRISKADKSFLVFPQTVSPNKTFLHFTYEKGQISIEELIDLDFQLSFLDGHEHQLDEHTFTVSLLDLRKRK